ncbi:MAG: hypothetical protein PUH30_12405 [Oscillospiraceae bacterium]|nr:hypothetical protein [Oscillospiraceae bacterium]
MFFKKVPEWLFIIYSIDNRDVSKGRFKPTIESSIPFATKDEAEQYKLEYINNIESMYDIDNSITTQFAVIPIHSNIGKIKITYTGNSSIRIGKSKTLKLNSDRSVNWYIDSDKITLIDDKVVFVDGNGNVILDEKSYYCIAKALRERYKDLI